ncbi:ArnT family glycosyltransferase [Streptomyces xiangluensis]|uniref:ArnT family glycosyltransferase n=1 Tax=Streptomyces xiangluensis TaxID=2665720 RepID=A0ABV8Z8U5_9ACTN
MTAVATRGTPVTSPKRRQPVPVLVLAGTAFVVTAVLRLVNVDRSGDLFVDELIYRELGISAAQGGFPRTEDGPFFLHPPGFFYLEAGWGKVFGFAPDVAAGVYEIRVLNALLAAGTAALLVLVVARAGSRTAAVGAMAVFALDPYIIRQNNRAMLDTETMFWVLAGYLVLLTLTKDTLPKKKNVRAMGAGLLFGLAVLTKEHSALITLVPLLLAVFLKWGPPRRLLLITGSTAVMAYGLYFSVVAATGHLDAWWHAKYEGVNRLIGVVQESGFNAPGTPSLAGRLTEELTTYGSTYAMLALGPLALVILLRSANPAHRLLALFYLSAGLTLLYALGKGTLEEQALYLLVVPNLLVLAVAFAALRERVGKREREHAGQREQRRARHALLVVAGVGFLVAALTFSTASYAKGRLQSDDGYAQLRTYMAQHVLAGSAVTAADGEAAGGTSKWALKDRYRIGDWLTPRARAEEKVRYLVVPWKVIEDGYGRIKEQDARVLASQGRLLFSAEGRTYGTLALYELPLPPADAPPGAGHGR